MKVAIRVKPQSDDEALTSLYDWLVADPDTSLLEISLAAEQPTDGKMTGGAFDIINAVISNAISLTSLLVAISSWRRSHASESPDASIEHNGASILVDDSSPNNFESLFDHLSNGGPDAKDNDKED